MAPRSRRPRKPEHGPCDLRKVLLQVVGAQLALGGEGTVLHNAGTPSLVLVVQKLSWPLAMGSFLIKPRQEGDTVGAQVLGALACHIVL